MRNMKVELVEPNACFEKREDQSCSMSLFGVITNPNSVFKGSKRTRAGVSKLMCEVFVQHFARLFGESAVVEMVAEITPYLNGLPHPSADNVERREG